MSKFDRIGRRYPRADDYPTIQQAIDAAVNGDEVIVSPGLYFENIDFLDKDLTVRGIDPSDPAVVQTTIIDGLFSGTVVTLTGGVIQGFTIRNGFAEFGGGVNALIDAEIRDNIILANTATFGGGGISADGDVVIENNIISENDGRGVYAQTRTIVAHNVIVANSLGGVFALHNSIVRNNTIVGNSANQGAGVFARNNVTISSNLIGANLAGDDGGGIYTEDHYGAITNNTIVRNIGGGSGSGIRADTGDIVNNIVAFSPSAIVAITVAGANAYVDYNCVFGNNGAAGATGDNDVLADPQFLPAPTGMWTNRAVFDEQTLTTTLIDELASFVDGSLIGQVVNPDMTQALQFAIINNTQTTITVAGNAAAIGQVGCTYHIFDFHLSKASPCIGAGDPTQTQTFYTGSDIDGEPRIQDCGIDIGVDEVTGVPTTVLNILSTMTTAMIDVSIADCNRLTSGEGSFNRFYLDAPLVLLTAENRYAGLPFRWVINGQERPFGVFAAIVELTDHLTALAEYFPVVNISRDTYLYGRARRDCGLCHSRRG